MRSSGSSRPSWKPAPTPTTPRPRPTPPSARLPARRPSTSRTSPSTARTSARAGSAARSPPGRRWCGSGLDERTVHEPVRVAPRHHLDLVRLGRGRDGALEILQPPAVAGVEHELAYTTRGDHPDQHRVVASLGHDHLLDRVERGQLVVERQTVG